MKNIYEIAETYKIPVAKLKRLARAGLLSCDMSEKANELEKIRSVLRRGNLLSARQLCSIARDDLKMKSLDKLEILAKRQIRRLGNFRDECLPSDSFAMICDASARDDEAGRKLAEWVCSVIPQTGCDYHYIAARILYGIESRYFDVVANSIPRAILHARKFEPLASRSETKNGKTHFFGKNEKSRLIYDL